jgi:hypothetical protein
MWVCRQRLSWPIVFCDHGVSEDCKGMVCECTLYPFDENANLGFEIESSTTCAWEK